MIRDISAEIEKLMQWIRAGGERTKDMDPELWAIAEWRVVQDRRAKIDGYLLAASQAFVGIALLCSAMCGCAPSVSSGVKTVNRGLVEIDQALERDTTAAGVAMIAQIEKCKVLDLKTEEERKQCLGKWAEPVPVEEYKKIRDAYDRIYFDAKEIETRNQKVDEWSSK